VFRVGDLVAESFRPYWHYGYDSYYYGYGEYYGEEDDYWSKPPPTRLIVGLVVEVETRTPYQHEYGVTPYTVYRVRWLNTPYGDWRDGRYFYESELKLLSSVEEKE